jgi:hypothetical protein
MQSNDSSARDSLHDKDSRANKYSNQNRLRLGTRFLFQLEETEFVRVFRSNQETID